MGTRYIITVLTVVLAMAAVLLVINPFGQNVSIQEGNQFLPRHRGSRNETGSMRTLILVIAAPMIGPRSLGF